MTAHQGGRARTPRPSARPDRPSNVDTLCILVDLTLFLTAVMVLLAVIIAPSPGLLDGRHLLGVAAVALLAARTTRAPRR